MQGGLQGRIDTRIYQRKIIGRSPSLEDYKYPLNNFSLIKLFMFDMCNKEHRRCLFIVSKIDIIWSYRGTPEFINYQFWASYKIFLSLKYLFHFFGWLHFFIKVVKSDYTLLSWQALRFRVNLHCIIAWISRSSLLETGAIFKF